MKCKNCGAELSTTQIKCAYCDSVVYEPQFPVPVTYDILKTNMYFLDGLREKLEQEMKDQRIISITTIEHQYDPRSCTCKTYIEIKTNPIRK